MNPSIVVTAYICYGRTCQEMTRSASARRTFARPRSRRSYRSRAKGRTSTCCGTTRTRSSHWHIYLLSTVSIIEQIDGPSYHCPCHPTQLELLPLIHPSHARSCQPSAALESVLDIQYEHGSVPLRPKKKLVFRRAGLEHQWPLWCESLPHTLSLSLNTFQLYPCGTSVIPGLDLSGMYCFMNSTMQVHPPRHPRHLISMVTGI